MLGRPAESKKMDDQPEKTMTDNNARDDRASVLRKAENYDARGKTKAPREQVSRSPIPAAGGPNRRTRTTKFRQQPPKF